MKTNKYKLPILAFVAFSMTFTSCISDLDTLPVDKDEITAATVFENPAAYQNYIAKIYAGLSVTGNKGPSDKPDIIGIDEGSQASYLRMLWNTQELPTDEAVCIWNDQTIKDFHNFNWTSSDVFLKGFYYRLYYQITLASEFLRESTDAKLNERGVSDEWKATIKQYRAEARFLRALAYYNVLDSYSQGPFVTEESAIGSIPPQKANSTQLFNYIESELKDCEADMLTPFVGFDTNNYGRATKAAAWTLLARLYLNAEVYIGTAKYTECITECNKVIAAGYQLEPVYANLFKADNYNSKEIIFPIVFDSEYTQTWGGMMFLMCAAVNGDIRSLIAAPGGWGGNHATVNVLNRFTGVENMDDRCGVLYTGFKMTDMTDPDEFKQGVQVVKFSNYNSDGTDSGGSFPNTDFPLFRLGDVYLMYAEAVVRGGSGGSTANALTYVNDLRDRAYVVDAVGKVTTLSLDFLLEERGREMLWEATRRSDLRRFGKFTSSTYLWPWKGGTMVGKGVEDKYNVFPIPAADKNANPNLDQNEGY
jgi:starch-binding outer membrane protein, SusD/RagB family